MALIPAGTSTPQIIIDVAQLEKNIDKMAQRVASQGLKLRPHAKTHKMLEVASRQLDAGAAGLTVATVGEALSFALQGVAKIFIAYPLWVNESQAERILELIKRAKLSIGTDSVQAVEQMARMLGEQASKIRLMIEIDSGHHRSGVSPRDALDIAEAARDAGMRVNGVFTFPGHSYNPDGIDCAVNDEHKALAEATRILREAGFAIKRISGGSTPTAALSDNSVLTEVRPGVYVFGDAQQFELGRTGFDEIALTVAATVVSRHEGDEQIPRRIVVDAGSKILGSDRPSWATGYGRIAECPDARISALSEHHATVLWPENLDLPDYGQQLQVIPNHVCQAVNLVDSVLAVHADGTSELWDVAARGLNY
ncbi:alanine racemase [Glutamicibacter mishrai]|uniref:alanine racemase n=1 Tax=Glutamicibacter mishrai TaxID=1775880 RepID=UPI0020CD167D|nr:alanine racemase [Glutamicibacter mishrai]UTT39238.1 alanine racemase [Glutamicibacter mishrai]